MIVDGRHLLFHYGANKYDRILTRAQSTKYSRAQILHGINRALEQGRVGSYLDHVSMFFEPIPRDLGTLYAKHHHPVWRKGQVLYEHVVDITDVKFAYEVVETPEAQKFIRENWRDEFLDDDKEDQYNDFSQRKMLYLEKHGLVVRHKGLHAKSLSHTTAPYVGHIRDYYLQTLRTSSPVNLGVQYATAVPHVMMYPEGGIVTTIREVNLIKLQ